MLYYADNIRLVLRRESSAKAYVATVMSALFVFIYASRRWKHWVVDLCQDARVDNPSTERSELPLLLFMLFTMDIVSSNLERLRKFVSTSKSKSKKQLQETVEGLSK